LGSKRKEPTSHQGIRESEPEQSPKKARLRFHTPDKRKREDKETMDLEPVKKKRGPPMPQATPCGLGDTHRTKRENHTGSEKHSSLIDLATEQLCRTAGENNAHTATSAMERRTVKIRDTIASDRQQNLNLENTGDEGGVNDEDKDDPVDGHRQDRPTKYDTNGRCPSGDDPDDDFRSDTANRENAHRPTIERSSISDDHGNIQLSNRCKLSEQVLNGDNHRSEHQEAPVGSEEDQGGEQSSDIERCLGATNHDRETSPNNKDPSDGQRSSTRGEDNAPDKDEYLPEAIGDEQNLSVEGQGGEPHLNEQEQNMSANREDSRDTSKPDGEQCYDTKGGLIPGEEEKRLVKRPNLETKVMDTETDTPGPKDDEMNPQIGLVGEEEVTERDLINMDSEGTRGNGAEDETVPGDLGELDGERGSDTRAGTTKGGEKKRKLDRPDTETNDRDPETDNTQTLNTDEPNVHLDLVEDERVTERDNMDSNMARGSRAEDATILYEGQSYNDNTVEITGEPTESDQLRLSVGLNECATRIAPNPREDTVMFEHLTEGPEEWCHDRTKTTGNTQQHTKNPPEMIAHLLQAVREQEADELEASPGAKILERDKKTATDGYQEDIDPETTGDGRTKLIRSNNEGQRVQPQAPPTKIAEDIAERNHVSKTLALLSSPQYDNHTNIVSAFDMDVTREDFEGLQAHKMLNEGSINWMMWWWSSQVNGRFGNKPPPPQPNPHMPRCYFVSTFWYTRMTPNGGFE